MESDKERVSHWFELKEGEWIQGLVAHKADETRVYVVTIEPEPGVIHDRWPKILS